MQYHPKYFGRQPTPMRENPRNIEMKSISDASRRCPTLSDAFRLSNSPTTGQRAPATRESYTRYRTAIEACDSGNSTPEISSLSILMTLKSYFLPLFYRDRISRLHYQYFDRQISSSTSFILHSSTQLVRRVCSSRINALHHPTIFGFSTSKHSIIIPKPYERSTNPNPVAYILR